MHRKERVISIKTAANARDVPYQSLIKLWLPEKLQGSHERRTRRLPQPAPTSEEVIDAGHIRIHLTKLLILLGTGISNSTHCFTSLHLWGRSVPACWLMIGPDGQNR
jgi:hypothetical protein